jgi:hypothetical protein
MDGDAGMGGIDQVGPFPVDLGHPTLLQCVGHDDVAIAVRVDVDR